MPLQTSSIEEQRALAYRAQWDARIAFRATQLRALAGSPAEFERIWENYRVVYDPTNYIRNAESEQEFFTPYDVDDPPDYSSTEIRLRNTRHAGDNSRHRTPRW